MGAVQEYKRSQGTLTYESEFGEDLLIDRSDLITRRNSLFSAINPSYEDIFTNCVSGNGQSLPKANESFYNITVRLSDLL